MWYSVVLTLIFIHHMKIFRFMVHGTAIIIAIIYHRYNYGRTVYADNPNVVVVYILWGFPWTQTDISSGAQISYCVSFSHATQLLPLLAGSVGRQNTKITSREYLHLVLSGQSATRRTWPWERSSSLQWPLNMLAILFSPVTCSYTKSSQMLVTIL